MRTNHARIETGEQDVAGEQQFSELRLQLIILGLFRFGEALAWTSIFPYAYFMVQSFGETGRTNTAFLVGLLVAVFTFCEFLSGTVWARISNEIGRKPTLLIGVAGAIASALFFGLSKSIPVAVTVRALGGLANPNVGVVQTCIGELVKKKDHQARAFSIVPFMRGFGSVFGPVLGGILAEPVKRYPNRFREQTFWDRNPFFLPNLIVTVVLAFTWLSGFLFLEETHPDHTRRPDAGRKVVSTLKRTLKTGAWRRPWSSYSIISDRRDQGDPVQTAFVASQPAEEDAVELEILHRSSEENYLNEDGSSPVDPERTFTCQVLLQILSVSLLAFHKVASDTLIPVFLAHPSSKSEIQNLGRSIFESSGGFRMDSSSIGNVLLSQAVVAICAQFIVVPSVIARFGPLQTYRWTLSVFPVIYCLTPLTVKLLPPLSTIALLFDLWIKVVLVALGYVCSAILITNTVPSTASLAIVNGASASFSCLARSIGPLTTGPLFDWSSTRGFIGLPFWIMSGVSLVAAMEAWFLDDRP